MIRQSFAAASGRFQRQQAHFQSFSGLFLRTLLVSGATSALLASAASSQINNFVSSPDTVRGGIPWANPVSTGPIEVLVIAPRFTLPDAVEFAHHLECELTLAPLWSRTEIGGPIHHGSDIPDSSERDTLNILRDRLDKKHDLIIAANFDFRILPDDIVGALADNVGDGTGLLFANIDPTVDERWADGMTPYDDADVFAMLTRGIGERQTPAWADGLDFVNLATLGQGHIAWLNYPGATPATHCLQPLSADLGLDSDFSANYFSLILRCARWAAGVESKLLIRDIEEIKVATANEEEVPTGLVFEELEALQASLQSNRVKRFDVKLSAPADRNYTVRTRTRRPGGHGNALIIWTGENNVKRGDERFPVYVTAGTGTYFLDVWLLDGTDVVDWYTQPVDIEQWPRIEQIQFDRPWLSRNGTLAINGIVELNPYQPIPCVVRARAIDTVGRRIAESTNEMVPGTSRVRMALEFEDVEGPIVRVEVAALDQAATPRAQWEFNIAATYRATLPVLDDNPMKSYRLLADWSVADQSVSRSAFEALRDLGLDGVYLPAGGSAAFDSAASGLRPVIGARMVRDVDQSGAEQEPLFFNPRIEPLLDVVRDAAPMGAGPFLLQRSIAPSADESANPNFVRAYQSAVQRDYHKIETLNAVWRTDYLDWSDLEQPTRREANRSHNLEPWMRYQAAIDETRSANWDIMASLMRQAFDGVRVGFDFTDPFPHESIDWRTTSAILSAPDPLTIERVRSYLAPGAEGILSYPELLLEDGSAFGAWLPWYGLLHRFGQGVWPDAIGLADRVPPTLLLDAQGEPLAEPSPALREALRIKAGLGVLLMQAERTACGIAIYDSRSSDHLNQIEASFATSTDTAMRALIALLEGIGYQYDLVSPSDALNGMLSDYQLLLLPMVRALSDGEISAISAFHRDGGAIVADVAPGQFDENGIARDLLPFDDLFGIDHPRTVQAAGPSETTVELRLNGERVTALLPAIYTDSSVETIEADVGGMAEHVPVWIVREESEGRAALLNHAFPAFNDPDGASERGMSVLMQTLLAQWVAPLPADVETRSGFFGETVHWHYGDARIVTLLAHPLQDSTSAKVRIGFDKKTRGFNRLQEVARSKKGATTVELAPGEPAVIVGLPYDVRGIEIETAKSVVPGERVPFQMALNTGKVTPGAHLIRVELVPPLSSPYPKQVKYIEMSDGAAAGRIRLALNATTGIYTIRAEDLLTGIIAERTIPVGKPGAANQPFSLGR